VLSTVGLYSPQAQLGVSDSPKKNSLLLKCPSPVRRQVTSLKKSLYQALAVSLNFLKTRFYRVKLTLMFPVTNFEPPASPTLIEKNVLVNINRAIDSS
jgi:hypothetical protein